MTAELVDAQFALSFALADELGVPRPRTLSLRDVPGTTRALLPHLVRNNITALSVGVNGGSPAPAMPNPGIWSDPASGASVLYMQTGQGACTPLRAPSRSRSCCAVLRFLALRAALRCTALRTRTCFPA